MLRTLLISIAIIVILAIYFGIAWLIKHINDTEMPGLEDDDDKQV